MTFWIQKNIDNLLQPFSPSHRFMVWLQKVHVFQDGATNYATTLVEHPILKKTNTISTKKTSFSHRSSKIPKKIPREDRYLNPLFSGLLKRYLWVQTPDPHHRPPSKKKLKPSGPLLQEPRCCCVDRNGGLIG